MGFLWIILGIAAFIMLVIVIWMCSMHRNMPWQNCLAIMGNLKLPLPKFLREYALTGERDYATLPDPLIAADGTIVSTKEQFEKRKKEILSQFETTVYGKLPKEGFSTSFEILEAGEALGGMAFRKQVKITVATENGNSDALMLLYIPKREEKVPVVVGLNFRGNHTVLDDAAIIPSYALDTSKDEWTKKRGSCAYRWSIADCIARGYAVATVYSADFACDNKETYNNRVISLFDEPQFKAIGAWAFGLMRMADYLAQENCIDANHMAVIGHSRLGKAALWAGANDNRFGLVISNDSGNSGASLSRGNHGETVYTINLAFPHWFASGYAQYGKNENALPVDQNLLLATIAPRKLYVANAEEDLWSDPQGAFNSLQSAKKAFSLYGFDVLSEDYPATGTAKVCRSMATHVRSGGHDITGEDWKFYLDYMDQYFIKEDTSG